VGPNFLLGSREHLIALGGLGPNLGGVGVLGVLWGGVGVVGGAGVRGGEVCVEGEGLVLVGPHA
jgi:hypothetical protein